MDKQVCAGPLQHRKRRAVCAHMKIKPIVLTSVVGGLQCFGSSRVVKLLDAGT